MQILGKRILVKVPPYKKKTAGGIILASSSKYTETLPVECEVIAVGTDCTYEFVVGGKVLVNKMATLNTQYYLNEPKEDEDSLVILVEQDVFAILENPKKGAK